jgi:putative transposase
VRLTFQSVIEEIVCEELGRARYQRRPVTTAPDQLPPAYRNGWQKPRTITTALGPVWVQRPKLRHAHSAQCDQLFGKEVTRTNALETLVISCWVRGLSDRDLEAMLVEVFGPDAKVSKTTVSRIRQRLRTEFEEWKRRDLSEAKIDYRFLDASFFKMHQEPRPSRSWPPGASTPMASRCSWPWRPAAPSLPTRGRTCSMTWPTAACAPRGW